MTSFPNGRRRGYEETGGNKGRSTKNVLEQE